MKRDVERLALFERGGTEMIVRAVGFVLRIAGCTHRDEQMVGDTAGRADVEVEEFVSSRAGGWRRVFGDRHLEQVAAEEHGRGELSARDHMGVVNAEISALQRRSSTPLRRPAACRASREATDEAADLASRRSASRCGRR